MKPKISDRVVSFMQFFLSLLFTVGYFAILGLVLFGRAELPAEQIRLVDTLFGVLSAVLVQQSGYWFSRQRGGEGLVDPEVMNSMLQVQGMRMMSSSSGSPDPQPTVINNYNAKITHSRDLRPRR